MSKERRRGLIVLFLQLEQLEKAGVPLFEALTAARDDATDGALRRDLDGILAQVRGGATLAEAMELYPRFFDRTVRRLVALGEKSGKLARVFGICLDYARRKEEHLRLMRRATREPKISGAIILGLAVFNRHTELPWAVAGVVAAYAAFVVLRRYLGSFRDITDRLVLFVPRLGTLVAQDSFARFAESLSLLYEAGVELRSGLAVAVDSIPNAALREAMENCLPRIREGASLHAAFRETGRLDKFALGLVKAGEDSGNLGVTLRELSEYYERKTAEALTAVQQLSAPVLTIITGAIMYATMDNPWAAIPQ